MIDRIRGRVVPKKKIERTRHIKKIWKINLFPIIPPLFSDFFKEGRNNGGILGRISSTLP